MKRIILLLDLDYFYAALEERRKPELKGKPVVVCVYSGRTEDSGAVATSNYEARKLGIKSGMYIMQAKALAGKASEQETVFIPVDMEHYRKASKRIMSIARRFADRYEQVSIDEIYLDVSRKSGGSYEKARKLAQRIKNNILRKEKVTCSIGIGPSKLIAKMAAGEKKPDGLTVILPMQVKDFLRPKEASELHGVGSKTSEALNKIGIKTIGDLAKADIEKLTPLFGEKKAMLLVQHANGIDDDPVEEEARKQISRIVTLKIDSEDFGYISEKIPLLSEAIFRKLEARKASFRTVSVLAVVKGLEQRTKSISLPEPSASKQDIIDCSREALKQFLAEKPGKLRRFGIRVSGFSDLEKKQKEQKRILDFGKKGS